MTAPFKPQPGDRVVHTRWPSYGTGVVLESIRHPHFPSLPTGRSRVRFGHISRACFDTDLAEPQTMRFGRHRTQLVAVDGDQVA
jgi:hypothetical protein